MPSSHSQLVVMCCQCLFFYIFYLWFTLCFQIVYMMKTCAWTFNTCLTLKFSFIWYYIGLGLSPCHNLSLLSYDRKITHFNINFTLDLERKWDRLYNNILYTKDSCVSLTSFCCEVKGEYWIRNSYPNCVAFSHKSK